MHQELQHTGNQQDQLPTADTAIDSLEAALVRTFPEEDAPVKHIFYPGLYVREIFMRAGLCVVSKIHLTCHPFTILEGDVSVYSENEGVVRYIAPYFGTTTPHTRRVLLVHKDTRWLTFHPKLDSEETVEQIEARIIQPRCNQELAYERIIKQLTNEL